MQKVAEKLMGAYGRNRARLVGAHCSIHRPECRRANGPNRRSKPSHANLSTHESLSTAKRGGARRTHEDARCSSGWHGHGVSHLGAPRRRKYRTDATDNPCAAHEEGVPTRGGKCPSCRPRRPRDHDFARPRPVAWPGVAKTDHAASVALVFTPPQPHAHSGRTRCALPIRAATQTMREDDSRGRWRQFWRVAFPRVGRQGRAAKAHWKHGPAATLSPTAGVLCSGAQRPRTGRASRSTTGAAAPATAGSRGRGWGGRNPATALGGPRVGGPPQT